jgi:hypothetical protein
MPTVMSNLDACFRIALAAAGAVTLLARAQTADLRDLARTQGRVHRFSTLFTAQDVRDLLSTDDGLIKAVDWCRRTAVTQVYVESFRDGYQAERVALERARDRFRAAGLGVSGCVTPTKVGKPSTGWKDAISCYTDRATQGRVRAIFEFAAGLFDEIMIDDFWFTDCACGECEAARVARTAWVGDRAWPVSGDRWEEYRCELMVRLSQERVLGPAKKVNPKVRLIIKYPQWYDRFHERGYEVLRETADFDRIWVGTETRDYADARWGGTVQYEGYFLMRWLGGIGGRKCGGGWYDWLGTTERTYVEQARQTVLAGARESMLFCYGGLQRGTGPQDVEALRSAIPELLAVAKAVSGREAVGVAAYKPANSDPGKEARVFDFVGMLGVPLAPCHQFPDRAKAAFFSIHALKDSELAPKLAAFIQKKRPVLITDGLAGLLRDQVRLDAPNVRILSVRGDPKSLLALSSAELDDLRSVLLKPFKTSFRAPSRVALYLFQDGGWVVENFQDQETSVEFNGRALVIPPRGWQYRW